MLCWLKQLFNVWQGFATMKEAILMMVIWAVVSNLVQADVDVTPAKLRHLMKKTYCKEMEGQSVYLREQLATDCAEKVQIFGDYVSPPRFFMQEKRLVYFEANNPASFDISLSWCKNALVRWRPTLQTKAD